MFTWNVSTDAQEVGSAQILRLYNSVGFEVPPSLASSHHLLSALFGEGAYGFFVFADDQLIAMARILSDDVMRSWVSELMVDPIWQDQGVGTALIESIKSRFSHTDIHLQAYLGQQGFFEANGIKPRDILVSCSLPTERTRNVRKAS